MGNIPQWVPRVHFYSLIAHFCLLFPDKTPQSASRKVHTLPEVAFVKAQINIVSKEPLPKMFCNMSLKIHRNISNPEHFWKLVLKNDRIHVVFA